MSKFGFKDVVLWTIVGGVAALTVASFLKQSPSLEGTRAAPLELVASSGAQNLFAHDKSRTIVNLYATWCGPCKAEVPEFNKLHREIEAGRVDAKLYGVYFESGDVANAEKVSTKMGIQYPIFRGTTGTSAGYGLQTYPTTVVVSADGRIEHYVRGRMDYDTLHELATHSAH